VELVLITHWHRDHTDGIDRLVELTGAPVRAALPEHCRGADPLADGEVVQAAGLEIRVVATPGHTADSLCFFMPEDGPRGAVLTGDTILGRGSFIESFPLFGYDLAQYDELFDEKLKMLLQIRDEEVVTWHGHTAPCWTRHRSFPAPSRNRCRSGWPLAALRLPPCAPACSGCP
ncbi:MBL fold metallo-hydrolase, partial [Thermocatellispora tengchongensis]|uniref:MBL fold metallo-hydrolase n=1 Tax=Thermocatellispora tengchongensis TaxID=1073253 RepID=UPI0031EFFCDA